MKQKKPKSTLMADNTRGLITTKQTKPRPVAFAAPHPITPTNKAQASHFCGTGEIVSVIYYFGREAGITCIFGEGFVKFF